MFRWSSSTLNPKPASDIIWLEDLDTMCYNENRAPGIFYCHKSIPTGIDLDHCSTHPAIMKIEKNNFSVVEFEPTTLPLRSELC